MRAVKGNKEYTIDEAQKRTYQDAGFDILNEDGAVMAYGRGKTVPYEDYAALKAENVSLKEKIEQLEKTIGPGTEASEEEKEPVTDKSLRERQVINVPYEPYATLEYYLRTYGGTIIPEEELQKALRQASRHIDSLTYNRIVGRGFSDLTEFQQELICEVVCQQADFEYENADEINTILKGYSINGVSAQFGSSWNVFTDKGVAMKRDIYALLSQTGLCCRLAR